MVKGKILLGALLLTAAPVLFGALRTGDKAAALQVNSLAGGAFSPLKDADAPEDTLKILVFAQVRTPSGRDAAQILSAMRKFYAGKPLGMALVAVDSSSEVSFFLRDYPGLPYAVMHDETQHSASEYLGPKPLLPKCYVINKSGRIIWDGEVIDLPEMLEKFYSGRYNASVQEKIAPYIDELQLLLRGGDDRRAAELTDKILKKDPGNSAALRMRLFMLENTQRQDEAWKLLEHEIALHGDVRRNYLVAFDFIRRYSAYGKFLPELCGKYISFFPADPKIDVQLAWTLLSRFEFNIPAFEAAEKLLSRLDNARGYEIYSVRALLAYRRCDPEKAEKLQLQAIEEAAPSDLLNRSNGRRLAEFYRYIYESSRK